MNGSECLRVYGYDCFPTPVQSNTVNFSPTMQYRPNAGSYAQFALDLPLEQSQFDDGENYAGVTRVRWSTSRDTLCDYPGPLWSSISQFGYYEGCNDTSISNFDWGTLLQSCGFNSTKNSNYVYDGSATVTRTYIVTPPEFERTERTLSQTFQFLFVFPITASATTSVDIFGNFLQTAVVASLTTDPTANGRKTVTLVLQTKYPLRVDSIYNVTVNSQNVLQLPGVLGGLSYNSNNESVQQHVLSSVSCAGFSGLVLGLAYTMRCREDAVGCVPPSANVFTAAVTLTASSSCPQIIDFTPTYSYLMGFDPTLTYATYAYNRRDTAYFSIFVGSPNGASLVSMNTNSVCFYDASNTACQPINFRTVNENSFAVALSQLPLTAARRVQFAATFTLRWAGVNKRSDVQSTSLLNGAVTITVLDAAASESDVRATMTVIDNRATFDPEKFVSALSSVTHQPASRFVVQSAEELQKRQGRLLVTFDVLGVNGATSSSQIGQSLQDLVQNNPQALRDAGIQAVAMSVTPAASVTSELQQVLAVNSGVAVAASLVLVLSVLFVL